MAQKFSLLILRLALGWLFFYAGITKVLDSAWTAKGYISSAKNFPELYNFFLQPQILPLVDLLNKWGLTLIGIALILGIFTRIASFAAILLMALYYLALSFPQPNPHSYLVDEHIIYMAGLLVIIMFNAGKAWGLESKLGWK